MTTRHPRALGSLSYFTSTPCTTPSAAVPTPIHISRLGHHAEEPNGLTETLVKSSCPGAAPAAPRRRLGAQRAARDRLLVAARAVAAVRAALQQPGHRVDLAADGAVRPLLPGAEDDALHAEGFERAQAAHARLGEAKTAGGIALRRALELAPLGEHTHHVQVAVA